MSPKKTNIHPSYWLQRAKMFARGGHYSNFNEQELIDKYIKVIGIDGSHRTFVDIGAGDGMRHSNTFGLVTRGWQGVGFEFDPAKAAKLAGNYSYYPNASACHACVSPDNVLDLLREYKFESDFGVLSLDIDRNDYWVLDRLLSKYRPRLIVSEYNEKIPPPIKFVVRYKPDFTLRHHFFGYSIAKLQELLDRHNYAPLEVEYNNVFLAPAELSGVAPMSVEQAYREGYAGRADRRIKFAQNDNMEALQTMNPDEGIDFLNGFYSAFTGEYEIGL